MRRPCVVEAGRPKEDAIAGEGREQQVQTHMQIQGRAETGTHAKAFPIQ